MNPSESRRKSRRLLIAAGAVVVLTVGALVWYTVERLVRIEQRLSAADERSQAVLRQMDDYARAVQLSIQRTREATERAAESQKARDEAKSQAEHAQSEADQARTEARQTREDLDQLRRRREQELERMRTALSRIAPTHKTPLGMVLELTDDSFKFAFDQSELSPENREILSRIAGVLLASKGYGLYVYGHTDDIGTDEYNKGLSERRAQAVAGYLIKAGIPEDIITTKGYGKSSPRDTAETKQARQRNRRVEIGIVDTIINYEQALPNR